jgi:hypothetical protein
MELSSATPTVFKTILDPLLPLLRASCSQRKDDADVYTLSWAPFVINLVFAGLNNVKSISLLVTEIGTSTFARELGLTKASKSMYSEAFVRYPSTIFRSLFHRLLEQMRFVGIPELQLLGHLVCVDGSLIPAIKNHVMGNVQKSKQCVEKYTSRSSSPE